MQNTYNNDKGLGEILADFDADKIFNQYALKTLDKYVNLIRERVISARFKDIQIPLKIPYEQREEAKSSIKGMWWNADSKTWTVPIANLCKQLSHDAGKTYKPYDEVRKNIEKWLTDDTKAILDNYKPLLEALDTSYREIYESHDNEDVEKDESHEDFEIDR